MKFLKLIIITISSLLSPFWNAQASTVVIDSFTESGFTVGGFGNPFTSTGDIQSQLVATRVVVARGPGRWTATLNPSDGFLRYEVVTTLESPVGSLLYLTYYPAAGETINLLGQDTFLLTFSGLTGQGDLQFGAGVRLPLTASGEVLYPFSYLTASLDLSALPALQFEFYPTSADFSFTLNEISVIPEPSAMMFIAITALGLSTRKGRIRRH
jgi:hypothetical protein